MPLSALAEGIRQHRDETKSPRSGEKEKEQRGSGKLELHLGTSTPVAHKLDIDGQPVEDSKASEDSSSASVRVSCESKRLGEGKGLTSTTSGNLIATELSSHENIDQSVLLHSDQERFELVFDVCRFGKQMKEREEQILQLS